MELYLTEIQVADWPTAVRWYQDTLGLRLVLEDVPNQYAVLEAGVGRLAVKQGEGGNWGGPVRLFFRVDDLEAIANELGAKGLPTGEPSEHPEEQYRALRLQDPSGTPITLFAWTSGG